MAGPCPVSGRLGGGGLFLGCRVVWENFTLNAPPFWVWAPTTAQLGNGGVAVGVW